MKKILLLLLSLGVLALGFGLFFLLSNLNSLVSAAIESHGSEATQTRVAVSGVEIQLREGRGSISGLEIGSPEGFKASNVFSLGDITIDVDASSVHKDPIVIDEIRIQAPVIYAEFNETGSSNIDAIRKHLDQKKSGSSTEGSGEQKKIRIDRFVFEKAQIHVDATALGLDERTVALPEIRMDNIGGSGGAEPDQIARIILTRFAKETTSQIANSEINRLISEKLGGSLGDKAKGLLDKIIN